MDGGHDMLALPLVDVELVCLDEEQLTILRSGDRRPWYQWRVETIANVAVLKGVLDHLVRQRARSQLSQALATYHAGTPLAFGRVLLTQEGIEVDHGHRHNARNRRRKQLAWHEVATIKVTDDLVTIQSRRDTFGSWQRLARWMVPNAALLQEVAASLLHERR
jgi:hypothetical protein